MSNETSEFGGWRKQPKVSVWRPKAKDRPYVVAREDGDEPAYTATLAPQEATRPGEVPSCPKLLDTIPVFFSEAGAGDEKRARETAQHVCEQHWQTRAAKLSVASGGQLDWSYNEDTHVYTAPAVDGRTYSCEEDDDGRCYVALDGDEIGPDAAKGHETPEAAQAVCQWHTDTELRWREAHPGEIWVATSTRLFPSEDYACAFGILGSGDSWAPEHCGDSIGDLQSLEEAKEACQDHHREAHPYEAPEPEPVAEPKLPGNGELGEWLIPRPLTEAELAVKGRELGDIVTQLGRETLKIAAAKERAKKTIKAAEAEIEALNEQALPLAEQLDAGEEHRLVECLRHKDQKAGELYYTDPDTGEELHRHAVPKGEQQQLWGGSKPPPADKPPEPPPAEARGTGELDWVQCNDGAWVSGVYRVEVEEGSGDVVWMCAGGEMGRATNVSAEELAAVIGGAKAACRADNETALARAAEQTDPLLVDLDLGDRRAWSKVGGVYVAGDVEGEHYAVGRQQSNDLWGVDYEVGGGAKPRQVQGEHKRLKDAFAAAHQDNQRRLRWPSAGADKHVLLSHDGRYQLHRVRPPGHYGMPDAWRAELVGCLGNQNTQLNSYDGDPLAVAQEVCQEHATEQRGAGQ